MAGFYLFAPGEKSAVIKPSTLRPVGTNWTFSLLAGDRVIAIVRDGRSVILKKSNGEFQTNCYDAGHTTLKSVRSGEKWDFPVYVPLDTVQVRVIVNASTAAKGVLLLLPIAQIKHPHSLDSIMDGFERRFIGPCWRDEEIQSQTWIKKGVTWVKKME